MEGLLVSTFGYLDTSRTSTRSGKEEAEAKTARGPPDELQGNSFREKAFYLLVMHRLKVPCAEKLSSKAKDCPRTYGGILTVMPADRLMPEDHAISSRL